MAHAFESDKIMLTLTKREAKTLAALLNSGIRGVGEFRDILTDGPGSISKSLNAVLGDLYFTRQYGASISEAAITVTDFTAEKYVNEWA